MRGLDETEQTHSFHRLEISVISGLLYFQGVLNGLFSEKFILAGSFPCWQFFRTE